MQFNKQSIYPVQLSDTETMDFTCYHYIHRQNDPELVEKLSNGSLFQVVHPVTQEAAPITYPCLFEDADKKFMVIFNPNKAIDSADVSPELFAGATTDYNEYTIRVTHYLTEFFEKINILDSNRLDTEVECVKVLTHTLLHEQNGQKPVRLYYHEQDNKAFITVITDDQPAATDYSQELVDVVHNRLKETLHLPTGQVFKIDANWAIDHLDLRG